MNAAGPIDVLRQRIDAGDVESDAAQMAVADRLQCLHDALVERLPSGPEFRHKLLFALGRRRAQPVPRGLYIHGPPGRGKSMLMDLFFDASPVRRRRRVHVHPFMQEVHETLHRWRVEGGGRQDQDPLARLAREISERTRLLCFDEFQVEAIADAMIVKRLFEALFDRGVVVVATSNTAPDDLYAGGLQRQRFLPFIDLLKERLDIVELMSDTDYRRDRLTAVGIWHMPLDGDSNAALETAFARLTEGATVEAGAIEVHGRRIDVPRAARGVAFFSFADLCEAALGPADYWAIACRFQTVILAGIPQMSPRDRNAAKRFATLVETLYEQKTKLVCSASVAPDALYPHGDGSRIFRRIASRLEEMRSEAYLSAPHRPAQAAAA